ncbi:aspartate-semialdehyde dehydrogenase [Candidatus Carsonella ruddii]|uniref:aspartate-semialdehyde dehydrogenase n=1 Tax=Carsonella ruddii TaxID=114186 RepID=UPI003D816B6D
MIKLGIIGWRGLVGSVFLNRIKNSFINKYCEIFLFSTNKIFIKNDIFNAFDIKILLSMNILVCCQGSDYTEKILKKIKIKKWKGYWIDSSSFLRMSNENLIVLDPLNRNLINKNLKNKKFFSGANCTVSLALLLFKKFLDLNLIEWISSSSYQAISGAGSQLINETIEEINSTKNLQNNLLKLEKTIKLSFNKKIPMFFNAKPWVDKKVNFSQTKEEWKSSSEASKILGKKINIDSNCVRITSLRCHSQYFLFKIKKNLHLNNIYEILNNKYVYLVKNDENYSKNTLTPYNVCGKLKIFAGRIKKSLFDNKVFSLFSIGDQLLWGAAEPIKRFTEILISFIL